MNKKLVFRLGITLTLLVAAVMWLLSAIPATAETFTVGAGTIGHWIGFVVTLGIGIAFALRGFMDKSNGPPILKRLWIIFGIALVAVAVIIIIEIFVWFEDGVPVMPIVAVGLGVALFLSLIVVGGRKWDQADNEKKDSQPARKMTEWEKRQAQNRIDDAAQVARNAPAATPAATPVQQAASEPVPQAPAPQAAPAPAVEAAPAPGTSTTVTTVTTTTTTTPPPAQNNNTGWSDDNGGW